MPPGKIRALYEREAAGRADADELDDVAHRLYERARDVVIATDAASGRASCPRCGAEIVHDRGSRTLLACPCGFHMRWRAYARSFRDRELSGGNATPAFREFVTALPSAGTSREKMLLVDRVVHAAHVMLRDGQRGLGRPALCNLMEGTAAEVLRLLDGLAYGPDADPQLLATREEWRALDPRTRARS